MRSRSGRTVLGLVGLVGIVGTCLGCAAPGRSAVVPDRSARAVLDYEAARIRYPIDEFRITNEDHNTIDRAVSLMSDDCMQVRGLRAIPAVEYRSKGDRRYGLWDVDRARAHGFDLDQEEVLLGPEPDTSDPQWEEAYQQCLEESAADPPAFYAALLKVDDPSLLVSTRVEGEASGLARADPAWMAAMERYWACLERNGLQSNRNDEIFGARQEQEVRALLRAAPTDPALLEELNRLAVIEATCNRDTQLTQTLGDLEASYQAPLIRRNEAVLVAELEANRRVVEEARAYVAAHP